MGKVSASDLRQKFMENASKLLDEYHSVCIGESDPVSKSAIHREATWQLLEKIILQAGDTVEVDGDGPDAVLKAVASGKLTVAEAERLIQLYGEAKDIELAV